jgi:predicted nucleotidyltransferase
VKSRNDRILDWAIAKVQLEYSADISLLVVYGSYVNDTEDSLSDVDFYFIPRNDKAHRLGRTFIVEGIGYDLFPMRWERVEGLATLDETLTPVLGNAEIVYSGSDEETRRFEELQALLHRNLADPALMHQKAVDRLAQAIDAWSKLVAQSDLCHCRLFAGSVLMRLADAVAYQNLTYFPNGLKTQLADLETMDNLPHGFIAEYGEVIKANTVADVRERCRRLIASCSDFLGFDIETAVHHPENEKRVQEPRDIDFHALAELYGEIVSTFNKVYKYCESDNVVLAFISAVCLQQVLDDEVPWLRLDVLGDYDIEDLGGLSTSARRAEAELVRHITGGAPIRRYASVDEFLMAN